VPARRWRESLKGMNGQIREGVGPPGGYQPVPDLLQQWHVIPISLDRQSHHQIGDLAVPLESGRIRWGQFRFEFQQTLAYRLAGQGFPNQGVPQGWGRDSLFDRGATGQKSGEHESGEPDLHVLCHRPAFACT